MQAKVYQLQALKMERQQFARVRRYRKVADAVAKAPARWLSAFLLMNVAAVAGVISLWYYLVTV